MAFNKKSKKSKQVVVTSQYFAGKSVNVPHSEHRDSDADANEKNAVAFDSDGNASVSKGLAASLVEFYPRHIKVV